MGQPLTPTRIYELVAEVGFKKYFHLGGADATRELVDLCPINERSRVLDVGCASGRTACYLARRYGCRVIGVDLLPGMIERARQRASAEGVDGRVDFKVGDAQQLPLSDSSFDVVLGEFITGIVDDKAKAVREYVRVAKRGGTVALNEATLLRTPPPAGLTAYLEQTVGFKGTLLTSSQWLELLHASGVMTLSAKVRRAHSLSNPKEDIKDLVRTLPKVVSAVIRRPAFREFLRVSAMVPKDLLDYFAYGLYVGRIPGATRQGCDDATSVQATDGAAPGSTVRVGRR